MKTVLRILFVICLVIALAHKDAGAAEGGYSNYIPGTYCDRRSPDFEPRIQS